jgi:hypothetical protein
MHQMLVDDVKALGVRHYLVVLLVLVPLVSFLIGCLVFLSDFLALGLD